MGKFEKRTENEDSAIRAILDKHLEEKPVKQNPKWGSAPKASQRNSIKVEEKQENIMQEHFEIQTLEGSRMLVAVEKDGDGKITKVITNESGAGLLSQFGGRDSYRTTWLFVDASVGWHSNYYNNQCEHALVVGADGLIDYRAASAEDVEWERKHGNDELPELPVFVDDSEDKALLGESTLAKLRRNAAKMKAELDNE